MVEYVDKAHEAMQYGLSMATGNFITMISCIAIYGIFLVREKDDSGSINGSAARRRSRPRRLGAE